MQPEPVREGPGCQGTGPPIWAQLVALAMAVAMGLVIYEDQLVLVMYGPYASAILVSGSLLIGFSIASIGCKAGEIDWDRVLGDEENEERKDSGSRRSK